MKINGQSFSGAEVLPLFEGGKGISITNGETCGAWAANDCIGTFSGVNAGSHDENGEIIQQIYKEKSRSDRHKKLIEYAIAGGVTQANIAMERSNGRGRIHMNVLWEMGGCSEILNGILSQTKGIINGIVCGAGMPYELAEIASNYGVFYYPIVSSSRAFSALYRRSYRKFIEYLGGVVYEDPWLAGGHNGLSNAENPKNPENPYLRLVALRKLMNSFNLHHIPIIIAGGVWWLSEWENYIDNKELGLVAFQFGTRPIITKETRNVELWYKHFMSLKRGDVCLTKLSPTGFYSSAVKNKMLTNLLEREKRQVEIVDDSNILVKTFYGKNVFLDEEKTDDIEYWKKSGFDVAMPTPDNTVVFVNKEEANVILADQRACCGCLSACRFSSWDQQNGSTEQIPDPRTFCIQKTLQNMGHDNPDMDNNLTFAGHLAYRFAEDPFYSNGFIPSVKELIERILSGY